MPRAGLCHNAGRGDQMNAESRSIEPEQPAPDVQRILQVRLSADLYEWLRTSAFYQRRSMNALVNEALEQLRRETEKH
jgi:predicted HicB family RNase H-like nuclease